VDKIVLDPGAFGALTPGPGGALSPSDFGQYVLYDSGGGQLLYDADGAGVGAPELIATLANYAVLGVSDFVVV
jgi:hypothetical protein